jgi:hypothetical protein
MEKAHDGKKKEHKSINKFAESTLISERKQWKES